MPIKIAGWQKLSLIDYPDKMAAVIFLAGCNMRCHYCHNRHILTVQANQLSFDEVLSELCQRKAWLDAVVVSGGEPTLSPNLIPLLQSLRSLGLLIKLDTNGTRPAVVRQVIEAGLVDYVALDVKAPPRKHLAITGMSMEPVLATVKYLKSQKRVPYMLRTTLTPRLTTSDLLEMGHSIIKGASCWQIQQCRTIGAYSDAEIRAMVVTVKNCAPHVVVKGL
ncbi:MAG: anaerobic ribonucleoside-triphosphate reductase activating protein [Clostridia bacterium]|nr:anaerobic ribonucleoside-triphosphate reductase activating protein [Clostridia bacterium]